MIIFRDNTGHQWHASSPERLFWLLRWLKMMRRV